MSVHNIQIGTLVTAKRDSSTFEEGERGVCCHTFEQFGQPAYSFIFERGGYDIFSPKLLDVFLTARGVCPAVADYQYTNVMDLDRDFRAGRFAAAFVPAGWQDRAIGRENDNGATR